jgi:serine/threonine protein kinase
VKTPIEYLQNADEETLSRLLRLGLPESDPRSDTLEKDGDCLAGRIISGYELLRELGRGGSGVVYLARQNSLNRLAAFKVLNSHQFRNENSRLRFHREAQVVAQLRHPRIVRVFDFGTWQGTPFYSMAYIEGGNLKQRIQSNILSWQQAAAWTASIAETVSSAHEQGILHRDLKPQNILVDHDDQLHLADFGLARKIEDTDGLTSTGSILGSVHYLAPELLSSMPDEASVASDIYAIGAIFYEMLTGIPPFAGNSFSELADNIRRLDPIPPGQLRPSLPSELEAICLKCLRKKSAQRYSTASEIAEAIKRQTATLGTKKRRVSFSRYASPARGKAGWLAACALSLILILLVVDGRNIVSDDGELSSHEAPPSDIVAIDPSDAGTTRLLPGDPAVSVDAWGWSSANGCWSCSLPRLQGSTLQVPLAHPTVDFDLSMTFNAISDADLAAYSRNMPHPDINQDYVANVGAYDNGRSLLRVFGAELAASTVQLEPGESHVVQLSRRHGWIVLFLDSKRILFHRDPQSSLFVDRLVVWGGFGGSQRVFQICYRLPHS